MKTSHHEAASRVFFHLLAVLAAGSLAVWCYSYSPGVIKLFALIAIVSFALLYTLYAFLSGSRKFSLRKIWQEVRDFMYGLYARDHQGAGCKADWHRAEPLRRLRESRGTFPEGKKAIREGEISLPESKIAFPEQLFQIRESKKAIPMQQISTPE